MGSCECGKCGGARKWVWHCVVKQGNGCGIVCWSKEVGVAMWLSVAGDVAGGRWVWQDEGECRHDRHKVWQA